ncbi:MAG: hypothetical protein RL617_313, partial [Pseudomonadota bacterium]
GWRQGAAIHAQLSGFEPLRLEWVIDPQERETKITSMGGDLKDLETTACSPTSP